MLTKSQYLTTMWQRQINKNLKGFSKSIWAHICQEAHQPSFEDSFSQCCIDRGIVFTFAGFVFGGIFARTSKNAGM